jgi:hypothetical protein
MNEEQSYDDREEYEENAWKKRNQEKQCVDPEWNPRLRCGQITTTALRANLSMPRIDMQSRAKLDVVTSAAEITEKRFVTNGYSIAV